jgi:hypothetical protein
MIYFCSAKVVPKSDLIFEQDYTWSFRVRAPVFSILDRPKVKVIRLHIFTIEAQEKVN